MSINCLIVDDEEQNLIVLEELLEEFNGINIHSARDGYEAIEIYEKEKINLALIDIMMPKMDGIELVKEIRKREKDKKDKCFILMISAIDDKEIQKELFEKEIEDYIIKPINYDSFHQKLQRIIYKLKQKKERRGAKFSLFSSHYDPFFLYLEIRSESDLLHLLKFLESYQANPIQISKFANSLRKYGKKLSLMVEKDPNYLYITTNVKFVDKLDNSRYIQLLSKNNRHTYKIEILFKEKLEKISKTELKSEIESLKNSNEEFLEIDDSDELFLELDSDIKQYDFSHNYEKIDAITFLQSVEFSQEEIDELYDLNYELEAKLYMIENFDSEIVKMIIEIFEKYRNLLVNFNEINLAINEVILILKNIDINAIPEDINIVVLELFRTIQNDLSSWVRNVFVEQSVDDVHYLDASMLSSILQTKELLSIYKR